MSSPAPMSTASSSPLLPSPTIAPASRPLQRPNKPAPLDLSAVSAMKAERASGHAHPSHRATQYKRRSPTGNVTRRTRRESPSTLLSARIAANTPPEEVIAAAQREQELRDFEREKEANGLYELEYFDDVREYMSAFQEKTMASVTLIDQQPELEWFMRPFLVDFIIEIHEQYGLRPETLYLTLNIVDRYVSKRVVYKKHYQLVGCAALWIAAKYEDQKDRIPTVQELAAMCCNAYDETAFIQMEGHVLTTIEWAIGHPTAEAWLRLACAGDYWEDLKTQTVARFLMEITLFHREYVHFRPRDVSAAAILLARFILAKGRRRQDENDETLQIVSLLDQQLATQLDNLSTILSRKYSTKARCQASIAIRQWYLSGYRFDFYSWKVSATQQNDLRSHRRSSSNSLSSGCLTASSSDSSFSSLSSSSWSSMGEDEDEIMTLSTPPSSCEDICAAPINTVVFSAPQQPPPPLSVKSHNVLSPRRNGNASTQPRQTVPHRPAMMCMPPARMAVSAIVPLRT